MLKRIFTGEVHEIFPLFFLSLLFQDSNEIHFRVKMTTQMGKLKKSYSDRVVGFIFFRFTRAILQNFPKVKQKCEFIPFTSIYLVFCLIMYICLVTNVFLEIVYQKLCFFLSQEHFLYVTVIVFL